MGVLYIDKPKGLTSFDVCFRLRKVLDTKKIGHTGTLDPNATGVMVVLFDKDTKANQFLVSAYKEYVAEVVLGIKTDTLDIDGKVVEEAEVKMPKRDELLAALDKYLGKSKQLPPMTSAIKINGKKLYEYQRQQQEVEIPLRDIEVTEMELLDVFDNGFSFRCKVSSGTYIRSLVRDVLDDLGLIGTLKELRRTKIDSVCIDDCQTLDAIAEGNYQVHNLLDILSKQYQTIYLKNDLRVRQGKQMKLDNCAQRVLIACGDEAIAIYERQDDGLYHCLRGLW